MAKRKAWFNYQLATKGQDSVITYDVRPTSKIGHGQSVIISEPKEINSELISDGPNGEVIVSFAYLEKIYPFTGWVK